MPYLSIAPILSGVLNSKAQPGLLANKKGFCFRELAHFKPCVISAFVLRAFVNTVERTPRGSYKYLYSKK